MRGGHVVIGYEPNERGTDALALGLLLAGRARARVSVVNVPPSGWPTHTKAAVDAEWVTYLREEAENALEAARRIVRDRAPGQTPPPVGVDYRIHHHRGSGRGLADYAADAGADAIVIGSAPGGPRGHIRMGSTADQLLHGSPVPVLLAPSGYAALSVPRLDRLTLAYLRQPGADRALAFAASLAGRLDLPLRLLTMLIGDAARGGRGVRLREQMLERLRVEGAADLREAVRNVAALPEPDPISVSTEIVAGTSAADALARAEWRTGEVLVCASGQGGPLRRVFLGDMAIDILRASGVPVAFLPRGAAPPSDGRG
ncbi:universal stress protein [Marinactinospora thermotolerans]|uniref:Nucleotide-binding universal stress protein, UspA family n=1 Tax=Marinactinospora thermotolerans DSM 45154 TaxID=1122192 RepID=A0A1T4S4Q8_9ACTN|nr:universal stress protein [Marinactinospora thermotolerans]SKA22791.1 Nucleotide-binding universal stress protein, UspA family [Marinactinospora thermotolerans DSM 45154]